MTESIGAARSDAGPVTGDEGGGPPDPATPGDDETVEPVEVLVQLAEDGEIDPWDIDIVAVTDKFLARLDASDLRASGRALFYASVLLRMKSDALLGRDDPEPEERPPDPWEEAPPDGEAPVGDPIDALEREMDRRIDRKRARGTPETLDELVRELREHERGSWWKESREYETNGDRSRGPQTLDYRAPDPATPAADDGRAASFADTAHAERIDETKTAVQRALNEHFDRGRDEVLFREVADVAGSAVETYLGLLFLAHDGHVRLEQDEFFGDLWIRRPGAGPRLTDAAGDGGDPDDGDTDAPPPEAAGASADDEGDGETGDQGTA